MYQFAPFVGLNKDCRGVLVAWAATYIAHLNAIDFHEVSFEKFCRSITRWDVLGIEVHQPGMVLS